MVSRACLLVVLLSAYPALAGAAPALDGKYLCSREGVAGSYLPNNLYKNATNGSSMARNITCDEQIQYTLDSFTADGTNETTIVNFIKDQVSDFCTMNISTLPGSSAAAEARRKEVVQEQVAYFGPSCCVKHESRCYVAPPVESIDIAFASAMCKNKDSYRGNNIVDPTHKPQPLTCDAGVHATMLGVTAKQQEDLRNVFKLPPHLMCGDVTFLDAEEKELLKGLVKYMRTTSGPMCCVDKTSVCGKKAPPKTPAAAGEDNTVEGSGMGRVASSLSGNLLAMGVAAGLVMAQRR